MPVTTKGAVDNSIVLGRLAEPNTTRTSPRGQAGPVAQAFPAFSAPIATSPTPSPLVSPSLATANPLWSLPSTPLAVTSAWLASSIVIRLNGAATGVPVSAFAPAVVRSFQFPIASREYTA